MGGGEEVIELSVSETNALRAKLGLKLLRVDGGSSSGGGGGGARLDGAAPKPSTSSGGGASGGGGDDNKEELSLSVSETNDLRAKLGLPPLRTTATASTAEAASGRKASEALHAPATNLGDDKALRTRVEDAKAKRDVEAGIGRLAARAGLGGDGGNGSGGEEDEGDAADWAARMRTGGGAKKGGGAEASAANGGDENKAAKKKRKKKKSKGGKKGNLRGDATNRISVPNDEDDEEYGATDLAGMAVKHSAEEFEAGQTTVLTLADTSVLGEDAGGDGNGAIDGPVLENANLRDDHVSRDNLRKKRMVEMGMGHAGGYAGYDDDEFEEIGGSQAAGRFQGGDHVGAKDGSKSDSGKVGFRIGEKSQTKKEAAAAAAAAAGESDLFAAGGGRAISLQTGTLQSASDFLTHDEADAEVKEREKREREARKREKKLFKKMKRDKKKRDKKGRRRHEDEDDDDGDEENAIVGTSKGSILDDLEATAYATVRDGKAKNRGSRRRRERRGDDGGGDAMDIDGANADTAANGEDDEEQDALRKKRRKFDEVMEKGNKRTADAFESSAPQAEDKGKSSARAAEVDEDDGEDDAFLNAALAKARRLRRLKELQAKEGSGGSSVPAADFVGNAKGAEAVMEAFRLTKANEVSVGSGAGQAAAKGTEEGGVTFEFDETREFTRALRARAEQASRGASAAGRVTGGVKIAQSRTADAGDKAKDAVEGKADAMEVDNGRKDETVDMEELAEQMSDDGGGDEEGGFGSSAASAPVGRGLANVLSMLKQTGEITGKNAGKEELRGRAKDERTYDDYEALNLKTVVKIDQSAMTNDKDREFANREIKLEYRDEHGRLLTRKEAYRQMCYQFHGYGSSKKNEERRLKQIARERAEAAAASRLQGGKGTLGALKATQEATGKAHVVHKTG